MPEQGVEGGFCCLGVLCDIYAEQTGEARWLPNSPNDPFFKFDGTTSVLPIAVQRWSGLGDTDTLNSRNPWVKNRHGMKVTLAEMNDGGATFAEIADTIEENL
jgi:hypothetical protein